MVKEFYTKSEGCEIMGITKRQIRGMIERGDIKARGRSIARTEIERVLGHPLEAPPAKGKTELDTIKEEAEMDEAKARGIKAKAELERLRQGFKSLQEYEKAVGDAESKAKELSDRESALNNREAKIATLGKQADAKVAEIKQVINTLQEYGNLCNEDLNTLRSYYGKLCPECRKLVLDDLVFNPESVYEYAKKINYSYIDDNDLFETSDDDQEGG